MLPVGASHAGAMSLRRGGAVPRELKKVMPRFVPDQNRRRGRPRPPAGHPTVCRPRLRIRPLHVPLSVERDHRRPVVISDNDASVFTNVESDCVPHGSMQRIASRQCDGCGRCSRRTQEDDGGDESPQRLAPHQGQQTMISQSPQNPGCFCYAATYVGGSSCKICRACGDCEIIVC